MPFPKIEGYIVTEKLGSGSYSTVYKAYTKVGARSIVAVKCVDKSRIKNSGTAVDNLITEIRLLKTLSHPHIVHMKHFTWDDRNIYIIMEYCCGGDLSKYIQRYGRVAEKQVLYFLQQLASALKFLREKGVVHMDLKPHNLLLHKGSDGKYTLKVGDFGFAQHMQSSCSGTRGSPLYMAPEVLAGTYDARADLWSVGVIMYECLFGKAPYSSNTFKELVDKIQKQAKIEIPPNSSISAGCRDLLTRLLKHDPDERISYEEFFNHDYLDLEHMPSKENYEKAVRLMSCAVELDGSARAGARDGTRRVVLLRESLRAYREALRYLVPCAGAETDAVRRAALTDKLTRYMERAEEIKEYLKCVDQNIPPSVPPMGATSFGNTDPTSTCSYTYGNTEEAVCPSNSRGTIDDTYRSNTNGVTSATTVHSARDMELVEEKRRAIQAVEASKASDRPRTPPRFGLKRLFGRQTAVPHLNSNDSSLADNSSKEKIDTQDGPSDGCRIS